MGLRNVKIILDCEKDADLELALKLARHFISNEPCLDRCGYWTESFPTRYATAKLNKESLTIKVYYVQGTKAA